MNATLQAQFLVAFVLGSAAAIEDIARRTISNWLPVAAFVSGLAIHAFDRGWRGLGAALLGASAGFLIFLVFYVLGGMGGGDIKLMTGFGAVVGISHLTVLAFWTAVVGGIIGLSALTVSALRNQSVRKRSIPYAPAITVGLWLTLASAYR